MINESKLLWTPPDDRIAATNVMQFRAAIEANHDVEFDSFDDLQQWSVDEPEAFWSSLWDFTGMRGHKGDTIIEHGATLPATRFFPDATLNFAENIIGDATDEIAYLFRGEDGRTEQRTRAELHERVGRIQAVLRSHGVEAGDRVAAWIPNIIDSYEWMLGATGLGAIFTSASPDFGVQGVVDRFGQVGPKVLVAADGYLYGGQSFDCLARLVEIRASLPSVELVVVVPFIDETPDVSAIPDAVLDRDLLSEVGATAPTFEQLPFDHPVFVLYSSGTTGKPKSILHRAGGVLLQHKKEHAVINDVRPGDRVFYFTTAGWMMWNWLATVPASGATAVIYDGNPGHPTVSLPFDLADEFGITLLGTSAKFLESVKKAGLEPARTHGLDTVRLITSTGSPLSPEGFEYVYSHILPDGHLASMSGGTDLCGCLVGGEPTSPVWSGEIQKPALGLDIDVVDDEGVSVAAGVQGELVCRNAFPSMPLTFWGDDGDQRYHDAYYARIEGMWHQGDFAEWTERGGMIIHGRSDATLNPGGIRIGTAEIYRQIEDIDQILEGLVIGQQVGADTRIVLFVKMREGHELDDDLRAEVRSRIRSGATPRHVPAIIVAVGDIPRTRSGKIVEIAVRDIVHGREIRNTEAIANPEALDLFRDLPELAAS